MACINIHDSKFKKLARHYDVSEADMKFALYGYQNSNNLETWDENPEELKKYLDKKFNISSNNLVSSQRKYEMLHKIWENRGTTTYEKEEDAFRYLNHFKEVFGEDNVTIFKNNEGKWVIKSQEPLLFSKEMANILNNATFENGQRDKNGKLLAPNGEISKLDPYQWAMVRTKAFKEWFGDWEHSIGGMVQDKQSYYRGTIEEPIIDKNGNLVLKGKTDSLYAKIGHSKEGVSLSNGDIQLAIEYGLGQIETASDLVSETYDADSELERISNEGYYLIRINKEAVSNKIIHNGEEVKAVGDVIIPRGSYIVEHIYNDEENSEISGSWNIEGVSKVVDENGEPRIFIRSDDFNSTELKLNNGLSFATSSLDVASSYADENSDRFDGYVNFKNPYIVKEQSHGFYINNKSVFDLKDELMNKGYDGVIFEKTWDAGDYADDTGETEYWATNVVFFNKNQFKSATSNKGTFSLEEDNIYKEESAPKKVTIRKKEAWRDIRGGEIIANLPQSIRDLVANDIESYMRAKSEGANNTEAFNFYFSENKETTASSILDRIIETSTDENIIALAKMARANLKNDVPVKYEGEGTDRGQFGTDGVVYIYNNASRGNNLAESTNGLERTIIHEIIHSIASDAINSNPKFKKEIANIMGQLSDYMTQNGIDVKAYALKNEHEFISEFMSQPLLREALKQMPYKETNFFSKIWNAILSAISGGKWGNKSLYDKAEKVFEKIAKEGAANIIQQSYADKYIKGIGSATIESINKQLEKLLADSPTSNGVYSIKYRGKTYEVQTNKTFGEYDSNKSSANGRYGFSVLKVIDSKGNIEYKKDNYRYTVFKEESLPQQNSVSAETFEGNWTRGQVASQTDKVFLFGDNTNDRLNTHHVPTMTQAVIRGLPNAIGIDTKKDRGTSESSYFTDADFDVFKKQVDEAIAQAKASGKTIVIPSGGIGTGKAMLQQKAPKLFEYLQQELSKLSKIQSVKNIGNKTALYGVRIDRNLKNNYGDFQKENPNGIVAYRVNYNIYNTAKEANAGRIGNPFSEGQGGVNKGIDTVQKFYEWLTTGNSFGEIKATEEYRQAILNKILSTPEGTPILYYTELNRPSHATVLGYLINNKQLLDSKEFKNWSRTAENGYEVSTVGDKRFSALNATLKEGTVVTAGDIEFVLNEDTTIENIYQNDIKQSKKGQPPSSDSPLNFAYMKRMYERERDSFGRSEGLIYSELSEEDYNKVMNLLQKDSLTKEELEDFSYITYKQLWKLFAEQNPELIEDLRQKSAGKVLTDKFANTRVSQARALADILNNIKKINTEQPVSAQLSEMQKSSNKDEIDAISEEVGTYEQISNEEAKKEAEKKEEKSKAITEKEAAALREADENLYNSDLIDAEERVFLSNHIMHQVSVIITELSKDASLNEKLFGKKYGHKDFTKIPRDKIIGEISIAELLEVVKNRHFNPARLSEDTPISIIKKIRLINKNWASIVAAGYAKLITLENTTLSAKPEYVNQEDVENAFAASISQEDSEEKEKEFWQVETRSISVKASLSQGIRRMLERLYVTTKDKNGNVTYVKDKYGYGFDTFVDSNVAINSILNWCRNCSTMSQMEKVLESHIDKAPWVQAVLDNIKEEPLRSQFFQNFRKDFTKYSIITVARDARGNKQIVTKIINTEPADKTIMDDIIASYRVGQMQGIITTIDSITGRGRINTENVNNLKERVSKISADLEAASKNIRVGEFTTAISNSAPEITSILKELGVRIDADTVQAVMLKNNKQVSYSNTNAAEIIRGINNILTTLSSEEVATMTEYNPMEKGSNSAYSNYKNLVRRLSADIQDSIESSVYNNGKMYYSYVTPSYAAKMMRNLKNALEDNAGFNNYMQEEFGKYRWFKNGDTWNNTWLRLINQNAEYRSAFDYKVQLESLGTTYKELSEAGYAKSLILEFFTYGTDPNNKWAWYRVPILSNKPSSEFIKFVRFSKGDWRSQIVKELAQVFDQEILRFKTVLERLNIEDASSITNFDLNKEEFAYLSEKIKNKSITREDLVKDGKLITANSGASFKFLEAFNKEIIEGSELGQFIIDKINGREPDSQKLNTLVKEIITKYLNEMTTKNIEYYKSLGLLNIKEVKKGNSVTFEAAQLPNLTRPFEEIYKSLTNVDYKAGAEISPELAADIKTQMQNDIANNLANYIWNDVLATINIIQLTATDLAYYKNVEDFQKRFAQIHSPGLELNIEAEVLGIGKKYSANGKYSADGMSRTIYLKDEKIISDIIPNIEAIFDEKIAKAVGGQKETLKAIKANIIAQYKDVNATDAQAYNSPTSVRKKLGMQGKWNEQLEDAYQRVKNGDWDVRDLNILMQPIKPFVYSQTTKYGSSTQENLKVGLQNKNSEYLIFLADAIMRNGNKPNKLKAIMDFMEESAFDDGNYNGLGIDTIQFESTVKVGKQGVIDINDAQSYDEVMNILRDAVYMKPSSSDSKTSISRYNENVVHTYSFSDYKVQQEVPAHMQDHYQAWGSQLRVLTTSDILNNSEFIVGENKLSGEELRNKFQKLTADNIQRSIDELFKEFNLNGTRLQKNKALEKILQDAILTDVKYGPDLARACRLNKNGEFNIPLNDPTQSLRIQQLLNSIIRSRLYKQKIAGGPTVQTTVTGLSDDLKVVFKKDGSISHFESYMTCPSSELEQALIFKDENGNVRLRTPEEALRDGIITEDALKCIGYRIPTEGYYSMWPIKIKAFLPRAAGESVMLPKEITTIAGLDFDIDKAYLMFKSLHHSEYWKYDKLEKDLKEQVKRKYPEGEERDERIKSINSFIDAFKVGAVPTNENHLNLYDYAVKHKDIYSVNTFTPESENARHTTNNELFDLSWGVLTSKHTADKMFNPGNFDPQKKISKIVQILQLPDNNLSYNQLLSKSIKELEGLLTNAPSHSIINPTSQVYFHKQNMTAGKLIGIFANHNVSHAFIQPLDIKLKINHNTRFTFSGREVTNEMNNQLDAMYDQNGEYISKNIAGFLAASVDAVKDPVLNSLNLNTATTGVAMLLARLGFDVNSIGLFLTQPLIKKTIDSYFIENENGYTSLENAINTELSNYDNGTIKAYDKSLHLTNFSTEELATGIASNGNDVDFQVRALLLFRRLSRMTSQLGDITFLTKFNSSNNGPNGSIANTLAQDSRIDKLVQTIAKSSNSIFTRDDLNKIMSIPILQKFYKGARILSEGVFKDNFIQYNPVFQNALFRLTESIKSQLDEDIINKFTNEWILYNMTYGDNPMLSGKLEDRVQFAKEFIKEFEERAKDIKDNDLIKIIKRDFATWKCPIDTLSASSTGYSIDAQEKIKAGWEKLLKSPETRDLGEKLFYYNMYRTGLSFSPKTFLNLASVDIKNLIPNYVKTLKEINDRGNIGIDNFISQFKRNHHNSNKLVPKYDGKEARITTKGNTVTFTFNSPQQADPIIVMESNSEIVYADMIKYNDKLYEIVGNNNPKEVTYKEISTLGITNNFLEYDANSAKIESAFAGNIEVEEESTTSGNSSSSEDVIQHVRFINWIDSSPLVEEVISKVFSKEDLEDFNNNKNKTTFDRILDNRVQEGKLTSEVREKVKQVKEEVNKLVC